MENEIIYNKVLILNSELIVEQNIVTANEPIQEDFVKLKLNNRIHGIDLNIDIYNLSFNTKTLDKIIVLQDSEADLKGKENSLVVYGKTTNNFITTLRGNLIVCQYDDDLNLYPLSSVEAGLLSSYFMSNIIEYRKHKVFKCFY